MVKICGGEDIFMFLNPLFMLVVLDSLLPTNEEESEQ
jgi:hypothetical protein